MQARPANSRPSTSILLSGRHDVGTGRSCAYLVEIQNMHLPADELFHDAEHKENGASEEELKQRFLVDVWLRRREVGVQVLP